MNVLLLNLTRFGDLLQTQAAIDDLVRQGHRVGIVCLENFLGAAHLLSGIAHVAGLPAAFLLARLDETAAPLPAGEEEKRKTQWHSALAGLAAWRETLHAAFPAESVCNLTPSLPARLLALFLAQGAPCSGFTVDGHGFGLNSNAWAAFLQGASTVRGISPFNIVDLFRRVASPERSAHPGGNTLCPPAPERREAMLRRLRTMAPEGSRGFVALQLGASEERRRWPVASFAAVGDTLWKEAGLCPVLVGSRAETHLAERYAGVAVCPHLSLCGETDLEELASLLCSMRMLITNDTGTMHLAAGLGLPVLAVFLATAQPFDTGPYRADSCSLEPDIPCHPCAFGVDCQNGLICRQSIAPGTVSALALARLESGVWRNAPVAGEGARIWLSVFDEQGFMNLASLSGHENSPRAVWFALQRRFLRRFLDRGRLEPFDPGPRPDVGPLPPDMVRAVGDSAALAAGLITLLVQQGKVLETQAVPHMRERFLATWSKVHNALRADPRLNALALLWVQETQDSGQELPYILAVAEQFGRLLETVRDLCCQ